MLINEVKKGHNALQINPIRGNGNNLSKKTSSDELVFGSPQMEKVTDFAKMVAPTDLTVLLQGESGTGKEMFARLIYLNSLRKERPFIIIDCGTIPDSLAESELFGYEKGAFTGADKDKDGRFLQADGGTIFLDEINNLPLFMQMKLLRVIQEREIRPLGGSRDITVDVRIIAASNNDLFDEVKDGKFREDLFYRLDEFNIDIPPLRERKDDITVLAEYFTDLSNLETKKKIKGISTEALKILQNYPWPGNVRELKNVIRKAVLFADSAYINPNHLSLNRSNPLRNHDNFNFLKDLEKGLSLKEITKKIQKDIERMVIGEILSKTNGNKTQAAKILKIDRMTLYSKIKEFQGLYENDKAGIPLAAVE